LRLGAAAHTPKSCPWISNAQALGANTTRATRNRQRHRHQEFIRFLNAVEREVPAGKTVNAIRAIVNEALAGLAGDFSVLYSPIGRPSIPPEKRLRAMLLRAFIRSARSGS
jgi:hypothetical protein